MPGAAGGPQDAYRHARWNQLMAERMGAFNALVASSYHEIVTNVANGTQTWNDFRMDMHNNFQGALSDQQPMDLYNNGNLRVNNIDPQSGYS